MRAVEVLDNLKSYDTWEYRSYPLTKAEADVIIPLLEEKARYDREVEKAREEMRR